MQLICPPIQRTAIITLDNGHKLRATVFVGDTDRLRHHSDFERQFVEDWNRAQPRAVHKVVRVHLLRN